VNQQIQRVFFCPVINCAFHPALPFLLIPKRCFNLVNPLPKYFKFLSLINAYSLDL